MANLAFPQLGSGAFAQYPIRKTIKLQTIKNILADGSMLVASDPGAGQIVWTLSYVGLAAADVNAIQGHFEACSGPLRAFTFLDPADNLLTYSADLTQSPWITPTGVTVASSVADPVGGSNAFIITNSGAATQQITQTLAIPANYQYCFSLYASSLIDGTCNLIRSSANAQQVNACPVGPAWSRIFSSGALNDSGTGLSVAISLAAGQSITLFGPQLEPQLSPSRFRPTYSNSGLYPNAHWAVSELVFTPNAPNLFSTSFSIEASVWN